MVVKLNLEIWEERGGKGTAFLFERGLTNKYWNWGLEHEEKKKKGRLAIKSNKPNNPFIIFIPYLFVSPNYKIRTV